MQKATFAITGMSCVNCAARLEKALAETAGIVRAFINCALEELQVEFDDSVITRGEIENIVRKKGYGIRVKGGLELFRFGRRFMPP